MAPILRIGTQCALYDTFYYYTRRRIDFMTGRPYDTYRRSSELMTAHYMGTLTDYGIGTVKLS